MTMEEKQYFAFISYSSADFEWGKKVEQKLSKYKMSATLCREKGWKRCPMSPIFFAPYEIQPGDLSEELKMRLRNSKNLIVICSPNSAKSEWVGREIEYFHSLGRADNIHFFIVDGVPNSGNPETECFNPILKKLDLPEYLGANVNEKIYNWKWLNRERAYIQLVTKLLGIEFDSVWKRHERMMIASAIKWTLLTLFVLATILLVWMYNKPVDVKMSLRESTEINHNIPPARNAEVSLFVGDECKKDTVADLQDNALFLNIPHKYLDSDVRLQVRCKDFLPLDTVINLAETHTIFLHRDPNVYGYISFRVYKDGKYIPDFPISVDGRDAVSDADGYVRMSIPLKEQKDSYNLSSPVAPVDSVILTPIVNPDQVVEVY